MQRYLLPALTALLLMIFFLAIPDLSDPEGTVPFPAPQRRGRRRSGSGLSRHPVHRIDRTDALIMAAFTLVFGIVDFIGLGNREGVTTFTNMGGRQEVLAFDRAAVPQELHFFTGVGYGTYTFEFSSDGISYFSGGTFEQESSKTLRWTVLSPEITGDFRFLRVSGTGNVYLGEICVTDSSGNLIGLTGGAPELTDEQDQYCPVYDFMNSSYFDEIYHARTAWEHLNNVYPYEISHPPLGKLIISAGIALFGMTPFGWRFSGTLFGVLMLPIMYALLKKMSGSRRASAAGTLVFAADFMRFVQTRIATIDTYAVFFILLMFLFMYIYLTEDRLQALALSGICFGLGAACKWTCLYAGAGLAVLWVLSRIEKRDEGFGSFAANSAFCTVFFVLIPCAIYYFSYLPYGTAQGIRNPFSREYAQVVLSNQTYMFNYHSGLVATHPYSSKWYQWVLDIRPILYYLSYPDSATKISFGAFVNPVLCWGGLLTMFPVIYRTAAHRDRNAVFILTGYLSQLVPWIAVTRLTFAYHYFPSTLFLVMSVTYAFSLMEKREKHGRYLIWGFALCSAALFLLFYPVLAGRPVSRATAAWLYDWFPTWPL